MLCENKTQETSSTAIDFRKFLSDKLKDVKAAQSQKYQLVSALPDEKPTPPEKNRCIPVI